MAKSILLELLRNAPIETDRGKEHTLKFVHKDEPYQITLLCTFKGHIPSDWAAILGDTIGDKIRVEIGSDSKQSKLKVD